MGKRIIISFIAIGLMIFTQVCFVAAEEGVTDTEIHIAQFGPLTGPAKLWSGTVYGAGLFFKMINEQGGIHGRRIVYHMVDDSYIPAKTKAGVKRLQRSPGKSQFRPGGSDSRRTKNRGHAPDRTPASGS